MHSWHLYPDYSVFEPLPRTGAVPWNRGHGRWEAAPALYAFLINCPHRSLWGYVKVRPGQPCRQRRVVRGMRSRARRLRRCVLRGRKHRAPSQGASLVAEPAFSTPEPAIGFVESRPNEGAHGQEPRPAAIPSIWAEVPRMGRGHYRKPQRAQAPPSTAPENTEFVILFFSLRDHYDGLGEGTQ